MDRTCVSSRGARQQRRQLVAYIKSQNGNVQLASSGNGDPARRADVHRSGHEGIRVVRRYGYFAPAKTPEQFTEFAKAESAKRAEVEKDSGATVDRGCACADCPHAVRNAVRQCGHRLPSRTMAERLGVARRWRFPQRG